MTLDGAFSRLATLSTERLCLRQMRLDDAVAVHAFKSDPQVTLCYGQEPHANIAETREWLRKRIEDFKVRDSVFWVLTLKGSDTAIGECCLWNFDPAFRCAEVGYELDSAYWNRGLMSEALTEVIAYGFLEMDLHRIEACPYSSNAQSSNLLHKLGFTEEGRLRDRHFFRGRFEDQLYYGILREEWKVRMDDL
jgi:[ribosomal protein S5]-alanine N-acetyltransferase